MGFLMGYNATLDSLHCLAFAPSWCPGVHLCPSLYPDRPDPENATVGFL